MGNFRHSILFLIYFSSFETYAQKSNNAYGLYVIERSHEYLSTIQLDSNKQMVDISNIPGIIISLPYTTTNNFSGRKLYTEKSRTTYLRKPAADALLQVAKDLQEQGLYLKVWDAYRPYSVTVKMWEPVKDERYVANPAKGSGHNRGISVDLTLVKSDKVKELDMGTGFDNFSDTAHHTFKHLPDSVLANRALLKAVMEKHGFIALESEWWHYYLQTPVKFELLNLSFKALAKIKKRSMRHR